MTGFAVPVFGENEFRLTCFLFFFLGIFRVVGRPIEKADHVGVLLDGAGFPQVRHPGDADVFAGPAFRSPVELGEDEDGDAEFFGEALDAGGDFRDFPLTGVFRLLGAGFS